MKCETCVDLKNRIDVAEDSERAVLEDHLARHTELVVKLRHLYYHRRNMALFHTSLYGSLIIGKNCILLFSLNIMDEFRWNGSGKVPHSLQLSRAFKWERHVKKVTEWISLKFFDFDSCFAG